MRLIDADEFFKDFTELEPYEHISHEYDIDAEIVKHGEWKCVKVPKGADFCFYQCSICGEARWQQENYCANCGARMDEEEL